MDNTENPDQNTFYVGLCMAGAVSAGAYTAGVLDYLIEALTEYEKRRALPGVPSHKVQIPVMGGASAGGMTSVMAASAMNNPLPPLDKPTSDLLVEHPENKLYHSWVDLNGVDMFSQMLDTSDIKPGAILSGLNSSFIQPIAQRVVAADPTQWQPLPGFIKPGLKIFTTLSNLQGFPYQVPFGANATTGSNKYNMVVHNDYACFQLTEETITGPNDGWIPLNLKDKTNTDVAANAAMATGAFPVGLQSRVITRDAMYVNANKWLKGYITPPLPDGPYTTLNVDGGLINNEPFDKVRSVLGELPGQEVDAVDDFNKFTNTVLMIEPFPTKPPSVMSLSPDLMNVIGHTLSTMITQMRSKPVDVTNAMNDACAGQYLITPSRNVTGADGSVTELAGELAIACGALSGFCGFINKKFRVHDYFLGRYNCKIFLRDYFTVPGSALDNNPIFKDGYANVNRDDFKSTAPNGGYQIIPVFSDATDYTFPDFKFDVSSPDPNWPVIQQSDIDQYQGQLKSRFQAIVMNMADLNWLTKGLLWVGAKVMLNNFITNKVIKTIKDDLVAWKLLAPQDN